MEKNYEDAVRGALEVIKVELKDEFDRNFERKGFFDKKWKPSEKGMINTGELRRSIGAEMGDDLVRFYSDKEYAEIHNEGGRIKVTAKMHAFFWAKYKETHKGIWEALGKKRIDSYIEIPQRQFIGDHLKVREAVEEVLAEELEDFIVKKVVK